MEYRLSLSLSVFADIELALKLSELTNSYPPACGVKSTSPFHIQTMLLRNRIKLSSLLAR
jgi:hypothetical protein